MKLLTVAACALTVLLCPGLSTAGSGGEEIVVVNLPIGNDLYAAGGRIVLSEPVTGDLMAAGGSVIINGPVGEDLQVAGGSLIVNAPVRDDLRAAGGDMVLSSSVGGDLVVFGGNVTIPPGAVVEGDAVIAAGSLYLGGTVRGDLRVHGGTVDVTGTVHGNARLFATDRIHINGLVQGDARFAGPRARLGSGARFERDVSYWREEGEMDFGAVPVGGQVRFDPDLKGRESPYSAYPRQRRARAGPGGFFFGTLLSGIAVIILMVLVLKRAFRNAGEVLHRSFWRGTGVGLLLLLLLPVAAILAMATLVGIPLGLLFMALFVFSLVFGRVIAAVAFAAWLERRRVSEWGSGRLMLVSMGLYAVIKLVTLVPFAGWLAALFVMIAGYGAFILGLYRSRSTDWEITGA